MGRVVSLLLAALLLPVAASANDIKLVLPSKTLNVLSFQFGINGSASGNIIHGASVHQVDFTKILDSLDPTLEQDVLNATSFKLLQFDVFKPSFSTTTPIEIFTFKNAVLSSFHLISNGHQEEIGYTIDFSTMSLESAATNRPWSLILPEVIPPGRFDVSFLFDSTVDFSFTDSPYNLDFVGGNVTASPEPASLALVLTGLVGLGLRRKKR